MMKLYFSLFLLGLVVLFTGCVNINQSAGNSSSDNLSYTSINSNVSDISPVFVVSKVEVIHFHGTHQCYSCITVGQYAEETVNTYFADWLKSGGISFAHINGDLPENRELVMKYGVTSASLWIGVYDDKGFHKEENVNVWYKISNKEDYMNYLKGVLEKKLQGA